MALYDDRCWLELNGWGNVRYSGEEERAGECQRLRRVASGDDLLGLLGRFYGCAVHSKQGKGDTITHGVIPSR